MTCSQCKYEFWYPCGCNYYTQCKHQAEFTDPDSWGPLQYAIASLIAIPSYILFPMFLMFALPIFLSVMFVVFIFDEVLDYDEDEEMDLKQWLAYFPTMYMVNFIFVTSLFLNAFIIPLALFVGPIMLVIVGVTLFMEYWENRDGSKGQARENTLQAKLRL